MGIKIDWWIINSIIMIATGVISIILRANNITAAMFVGGINVLIGIALLQRSKIVFWIVFILSGYALLQEVMRLVSVSKQEGNFSPSIETLFIILIFACMIMLWQQIHTGKSNAK